MLIKGGPMKFARLINRSWSSVTVISVSILVSSGCMTTATSNTEPKPAVLQYSNRDVKPIFLFGDSSPSSGVSNVFYHQMHKSLAKGDWKGAAEDARRTLRENPRDEGALMILAMSMYMGNDYDAALYYTDLVKRWYGENADIINLRALLQLATSDGNTVSIRGVAEMFKRAYYVYPHHVASGLNLGYLYIHLGQTQSAKEIFRSVAARCDECSPAMNLLGMSYRLLKQYDEARQVLERAINANSTDFEARYQLAIVDYEGFHDVQEARNILNTIKRDAPRDDRLIRRKADFLLEMISLESEGKGLTSTARK